MSTENKKRGPIPKPPDEIRSKRFSIRLTDTEFEEIKTRAGTENPKQIADYIRKCSLNKKLPNKIPEINRDAWVALSRSASNINQIAKRVNRNEYVSEMEVMGELEGFRLLLIGMNRGPDES